MSSLVWRFFNILRYWAVTDILMPQPIVPVEIPQSRPFDSKKRNDILLKIRNYLQEEDLRWVYQSHVRKSLIGISR